MNKVSKKKKKKNNKKLFTRQKKVLIITLTISIICLMTLLGTSYSAFISKKTSTKQEMYKTGDLGVTFSENTSSVITLTNQYPITDEEGINKLESETPYTFIISNQGDYNSSYTIQIQNIQTGIPTTNIKYAINSSKPKLLSETTNNILDEGTIYPGEAKEFWLTLWIDENATSNIANKTYEGKIVVNGQATRVPYYKDNSGANVPVVARGMIPVVYDYAKDNWVVADQEAGWYSYNNQIWANAVTTSDETYRTAPAGTVIPMEVINSMWVWIPRYKYQIGSNIGSANNVTNPPRIDVVFESGTETTGNYTEIGEYGYYTHPAFRNGNTNYKTSAYDRGGWDKELTGIWVGKFETGTEGDTCSSSPSATNCQNVNPVIKPDVTSLRYQNVSTQFKTSLKFAGGSINSTTGEVTFNGNNTYGLTNTTDTHMMKNTEWGSVAYLTQSKYGRVIDLGGIYNTIPKEIYKNNSSGYYTGRSGGNIGGSTPINGTYTDQTSTTQYNTYGFYTYNDYLLSYGTNTKSTKVTGKGTGASTTGTIYGIYDMSGGSHEYTMSNWDGYSGNNSSDNSGFNGLYGSSSGGEKTNGISFPTPKYYDKYTETNSSTITKEKAIKGDATYETMKWYSDIAIFVTANSPWAHRGGDCYTTSGAGIFYSNGNYGNANGNYSFRSVLIP